MGGSRNARGTSARVEKVRESRVPRRALEYPVPRALCRVSRVGIHDWQVSARRGA